MSSHLADHGEAPTAYRASLKREWDNDEIELCESKKPLVNSENCGEVQDPPEEAIEASEDGRATGNGLNHVESSPGLSLSSDSPGPTDADHEVRRILEEPSVQSLRVSSHALPDADHYEENLRPATPNAQNADTSGQVPPPPSSNIPSKLAELPSSDREEGELATPSSVASQNKSDDAELSTSASARLEDGELQETPGATVGTDGDRNLSAIPVIVHAGHSSGEHHTQSPPAPRPGGDERSPGYRSVALDGRGPQTRPQPHRPAQSSPLAREGIAQRSTGERGREGSAEASGGVRRPYGPGPTERTGPRGNAARPPIHGRPPAPGPQQPPSKAHVPQVPPTPKYTPKSSGHFPRNPRLPPPAGTPLQHPAALRRADAFERIGLIGKGTFGEVYKAYSPDDRSNFLVLKKILMDNEVEGFPVTALREIRIMGRVNHPNVLLLQEVAYTQPSDRNRFRGSVYMVFEYMDHDLTGLLERGVVFTEPQIKCYSKQLLEGLHYLKCQKILHRDMKCSNILINNKGNLKIADFGLARRYDAKQQDRGLTNRVVTLWYRPPELLLGEKKYDEKIDIWGAGCIIAEMHMRKPILQGHDEIDQLHQIFRLCGTPNEETWPGVSQLPEFPKLGMRRAYHNDFHARFPASVMSPLALSLVQMLMTLDPKRRADANQALDHDWFWSDPQPLPPESMPTYEASHEMEMRHRRQAGQRREPAPYYNAPPPAHPPPHRPAQQPPPMQPHQQRPAHRPHDGGQRRRGGHGRHGGGGPGGVPRHHGPPQDRHAYHQPHGQNRQGGGHGGQPRPPRPGQPGGGEGPL